MAIWLRLPRAELDPPYDGHKGPQVTMRVGAASDVIRAEDFAALVSIDRSMAELVAQRETILADAHEQASRIVAEGQRQVAQQMDEARALYEGASDLGYRDGTERALAEWVDRLAQAQRAQARLQSSLRERVAGVIAAAVERIVTVEERGRLFERALTEVDQITGGAVWLKVYVHPDDLEQARTAFTSFDARWRELGQSFPLYVIADAQLAPGSCICESDFGTIDASLETQLRAMRSAVARALKRAAARTPGAELGHEPDSATDEDEFATSLAIPLAGRRTDET